MNLQELKPGDVFTIAGRFERRRGRIARFLALFGVRLYSKKLEQFRVVARYSSGLDYVAAARPVAQKSTPEAGAEKI